MDAAALTEALALAEAAPTLREAATALRVRFGPMRVVVVDAFDMRFERPAAAGENCQLYFAANDGHCWSVTDNVERAAGLYIAGRSKTP